MNELEQKKAEGEPPEGVLFILGVAAALIMLVLILGLLNKFSEWAFNWSIG